jgi:integrase
VARIVIKPNGRCLVRWREAGDKNEKSKEFKTLQEAATYKAQVEGRVAFDKAKGNISSRTVTRHAAARALAKRSTAERKPGYPLKDYLRTLIETDKELRPSTRELYLTGLRVHIEPEPLAHADIRAISGDMVKEYWAKHWSGEFEGRIGARRNVYLLLSKAFTSAIREGIIDVSPLMRAGIRQPAKGRKEEVVPLTSDMIEDLANAAVSARGRLAILLMGFGALRAGEVGGLRIQDVDFERCKLMLRQQVTRTRVEGKYISPLKTRAARRTVSVPCSLADELKAFIASDPPADDGRLFHGPNGELWSHSNILHMVKRAAKVAGIQGVFSHVLRHSAVSIWIEDGHNAKAIQRMVGHSDSQTTLQVYGHLFDQGGASMAETMERRRERYRKNRSNGAR